VAEVEFNIIARVGTSETDLAPYPGGSATVPAGKVRKIYAMILSNTATGGNVLTLRIYKGDALERDFNINIPSLGVFSQANPKGSPLLVVPSGRTLKAVASAASVDVALACYDE
jgi:hypothetical protein